MFLLLRVLLPVVFYSVSEAGKNCFGRRLLSGEVVLVDSVCEAITGIIQKETFDDIILMFRQHVGESQHDFLMRRKNEVVKLCEERLTEFEAQQCRFYLELLPLVDTGDQIFKAAWFDAFGDDKDKQNGCSAVVDKVNEELMKLAEDPDSPIILNEDDVVSFNGNPSDWISSAVSDGLEKMVVSMGDGRRRLLQLKEEVSCTVVGGAAAAVVAGASVVGVALGSLCRSFAEKSVPLLADAAASSIL